MKVVDKLLLSLLTVLMCSCSSPQADSVRELTGRIIPGYEKSFRFELLDEDTDCFELETVRGKVVVRGNNANSMAVGLNYYLNNWCNATVSWTYGTPVEMPEELPAVKEKVRVSSRVQDRFFLNYCTFGYTMPWWGWEEWEHFIDWMALNGVTMPLAITGQEAVWQKVWRKRGLTDEQIRSYFTGPAHLPWHRMSNIDYWEGPLPQEWIDSQAELQKKIVARERMFDMTPVLPAFAGHVPQELKEIYPDAEITRVSYWGGFADEYRCSYLAPMDPLYAEIQKDFMQEQERMFGTDHIYGVDPFNEIDAPNWDPATLAEMSKLTFKSLTDNDPDAVWLQMGWLFYADPTHWTKDNIKAYLTAVPQDRLILLDYYCEFTQIWKDTESFYGQPYIWCYLGNFGGNTMLSGNFRTVGERIEESLANGGVNLKGIGSTLEGFGVNQFMYEFVLGKAWATGLSDDEWIARLAARRTGTADEAAVSVWKSLIDEIYVEYSRTGQATLTSAHPCLEGNWHWTTKPAYGYTVGDIWDIWQKFLAIESEREAYGFDVVNLGRQFLGDLFLSVRDRYTECYRNRDISGMEKNASLMLGILDDMDRLVACHPEFSLKQWITDARSFGHSEEEKDYYEKNARTLISVWGDSYHLSDYASRSWSGMVSSFYKARWQMFFDRVVDAVKSGRKFDQKAFDEECWRFECGWTSPDVEIKYPETGDPVKTAREISAGYADVMRELKLL